MKNVGIDVSLDPLVMVSNLHKTFEKENWTPLCEGPNSNLTEGAFHQTYSWKIDKGAKVGKYNGLTLLLDAETYDYWYQVSHGLLANNTNL